MPAEHLKLTGHLEIVLIRPDGSRSVRLIHNLVVNVGKALVADRLMVAPTLDAITHMAVGVGTTPPTVLDTALVSEVLRKAFDSADLVDLTIVYVAIFGPGEASGALVEAGLFNADVDG